MRSIHSWRNEIDLGDPKRKWMWHFEKLGKT